MKRYQKAIFIVLCMILVTIPAVFALTEEQSQTVLPSATQLTRLTFQDLDLDIPAGASTEAISVSRDNADLTQVNLPYGFKSIGTPYCFGPHSLRFGPGKELKARFTIDPTTLNGYNIKSVKLYYINTDTRELEPVPNQSVDEGTGVLSASIGHFSSYVLGISQSWDGSGINPFMDYIHNGEEHVSIAGLSLSILSPVYNVKGRGLDINLTRAYTSAIYYSDFFKINDGWYWALPHVEYNKLYLANGAAYDLYHDYAGTYIHDLGDTAVKAVRTAVPYYTPGKLTMVYLNDGTKIEVFDAYQIFSDSNGNWIRYNFDTIYDTYGTGFRRVVSLADSTGHSLYFNYNRHVHGIDLQSVEQQLNDGTRKTIFTHTAIDADHENFADALGRTTTYHYIPLDPANPNVKNKYISQISYHNGLNSYYIR